MYVQENSGRLLDRDTEYELIESKLDQAAGGTGQLMFFEGPPGIGKTSILTQARRSAERHGFAVVSARATDLEQDYAWGVVRQLFMSTVGRFPDIVESTAAAALAVRLIGDGDSQSIEEQQGEYALIHSLVWLTNDVAARGPLLLLVDDAHWCDIPSLRFLAYLAVGLAELPVAIVVGARPGPERVEHILSAMVDSADATVHTPLPLTLTATGELLASVVGEAVNDRLVERCQELTHGNPLLVRELGRELARDSNPSHIDNLHLPNLDRYVGLQLRRLPEYARKSALALSVLADQAAADWVSAVAGLSVGDTLAGLSRLQEEGLVSGSPTETYSVSHPLVRSAIYDGMSAADRAGCHARAAEVALSHQQLEKAAGHLLRVPPGLTTLDVVSIMHEAARLSVAQGSVDSAIAYLQRQLHEDLGDHRLKALTALGLAEASVNDKQALEHLTAALQLAESSEQRVQLTLGLAMVTWTQEGPDRALQLVRSALELPDDLSVNDRQSLHAVMLEFANMTPMDLDLDQELENALLLDPSSSTGGQLLNAMVGLMFGFRNQRERAQERALLALKAGIAYQDPRAEPLLGSIWETLEVCDSPEAAATMEAALSHGRRAGSLRVLVVAHCYHSGLMLATGNLADAISDGRAAWEACKISSPDARMLWIGNYLVQALVACGRYEEATLVLSQMRTRGPRILRHIDGDSELSLLLALGQVDQALQLVDIVRRDAASISMRNPMQSDWRGYLVRCLHLAGRDEEARAAATDCIDTAKEWGTARAVGRALRHAAVAESSANQIDLLAESVNILLGSEAKYELAQSKFALGDALRRAKHNADARAHLQAALELSEFCGAIPLKEQSVGALRMLGARPLMSVKLGPAALTPGERRVVDLAVCGLTNREIAQSLFVTVKTVEVHLSNTFRKLGIDRRQELRRALTPSAAGGLLQI